MTIKKLTEVNFTRNPLIIVEDASVTAESISKQDDSKVGWT